jgi:E1A/CREB-binding protein
MCSPLFYPTMFQGFGITSKADAIEACKNDATCSLCGKFRLLFEAPALYCREVCCLQKIRRNMHYYTDQYKSNQWCDKCYAGLKEDNIIQLDDGKETKKSLLVRLKNDLTPEEQWVQCDDCHECCHQVCALFNGSRGNSGNTFSCPKCIVAKSKERQGKQDNASLSSFKDAKALPECNLSKSIECGLSQTLTEEYEKIAIERECDVSQVEKADGLCVRVVMSLEKNHKVREGVSGWSHILQHTTLCLCFCS